MVGSVLLVEDEDEVRELIADALADVGLEVACAANDTQAYALLELDPRRFDVLVADINLGVGTTGFDVSRRARMLNPDLKVIYITGDASHQNRFAVDGAEIFPKPFSARDLALRVSARLA